MPTVPVAQNRVGIASVTDAKLRPQDGSGTGLAAIGAGLQQVGSAGAELAEQQQRTQDIYDDAAVKKSWNGFSEGARPLLRTGENAFYNQQGFNAGTALKPTEDALKKLRDETRAGLKNDRQRALYDQAIGERFGREIEGLYAHADKEFRVEQGRQSEAVKINSANDALDHADDPVMFGEYLATGVKAIEGQGRLNGQDAEVTKAEVAKYKSGVYTAVVDQKMTADPVGAAAYLLKHQDDISFGDRVKAQKGLYDPLMERQAVADVDGYFGSQSGAIPVTPPSAPGTGTTAARMIAITAHTESGNRDYANGQLVTSPKGAQGRMQTMPTTQRDPGFGVKPAQDGSVEEMNRVGRDYLAAMVRRYNGDAAKAWAAYNGGPGRVDAAVASKGAAWLSGMPKESRDYVATNMAALGGNGTPTYAPRKDDLNGIYQWVDAQPWDFERKQRARKEADNRVARNDKLLAREEDAAKDQALTVVEGLGEGFTSIAQLPADVRRRLSPETRLSLMGQAQQNAKPKAVDTNGEAVVNLHQLAELKPEDFKKQDLRLLRHQMTAGEYDQLSTLQARMIAKPNPPEAVAHSRIWSQINFYGRDLGVDMGAKGKNESEEKFKARRQDGQRLFTVMQNYLNTLTDGGKRPATDDELKKAFDNAVMPRRAADGTVMPRYRDATLPMNSVAVPEKDFLRIQAMLRSRGQPADAQSVSRWWVANAK